MISNEIIKQIKHIEIQTKILVNNMFGGEYHSAFKGIGMEFDEVREYTPGDDIRNIDWNLTAKTIMSVDEWKLFFKKTGYQGDYFWFIP